MAYKMRRILQCGISFVCSWSQRPPTISVGFALVCGSLVHFRVVGPLFDAMNLTKRNLFEASIVCFLICMASELRALVPGSEHSKKTSGCVDLFLQTRPNVGGRFDSVPSAAPALAAPALAEQKQGSVVCAVIPNRALLSRNEKLQKPGCRSVSS